LKAAEINETTYLKILITDLSHPVKAMCTHASIKLVNHHQQKYQYQYPYEKKSNSLVNVIEEPKVQIIIVEDLDAIINIARIILLAATKKKVQNRSGKTRSE
jgi:hypothetical protein